MPEGTFSEKPGSENPGSATSRPPVDRELEQQLDQLIPPPTGPGRKLATGVGLLVLAVAFTVLNLGGYLTPRPTAGSSYSSDSIMEVDSDQGLVTARVMLPNNSRRTIRLTGVTFDGPGAELIDVGLTIEPDITRTGSGSAQGAAPATVVPSGSGLYDDAVPFPALIGPGQNAFVVLRIRPVECIDHQAPWGTVQARIDFGDGAFPPWSRTIAIDQDPVWEGDTVSAMLSDGTVVSGTGPLALACEVLR